MSRVKSGMLRFYQRGVWHGMKSVWRDAHRGLTLATLIGTCLLIQLIVIFSLVTFGTQSNVTARAAVRVEFVPEASEQDIAEFRAVAETLPGVESAVYVPKEKAYEQMRQHDPELIRAVEDLSLGNPFPDSVTLTPSTLAAYQDIRELIDQPTWKPLVDPSALQNILQVEQSASELQGNISSASALITLFIELTIGILLCTIITIVALRFRRRGPEITTQYLLGASVISIGVPLISEGLTLLIVALIGSAVGVALVWFAIPFLAPYVGAESLLPSVQEQLTTLLPTWLPQLIATELLTAICLVVIAAIFALTGKKIVRPALV